MRVGPTMSEYAQLATADDEQAEEIARLRREIEQLEEENAVAEDVAAHVAVISQKNEEIVQQLVVALTPRPAAAAAGESVRRDSVTAAGARQQEHFSVVPLVADDEEKPRLLLLSSVGHLQLPAAEGDFADAAGRAPPAVPSNCTLRETAAGKRIWGNSWFLPDASAFAMFGHDDKQLALWYLSTGRRTVLVERTGGIPMAALSPDGRSVCVAAADGLGMCQLNLPAEGSGEVSCELRWDAGTRTKFIDCAFSRDSAMIASVQQDTGLVEIRDTWSNSLIAAIDDFPAGFNGDRPNALCFANTCLAVGGGREGKNKKQVWLVSIASNFQEVVATLELPGTFSRLAFDATGTRLAVGTNAPADLLVFSDANGWNDPPLRLGVLRGGERAVSAVSFSSNGRLIAAGCAGSAVGSATTAIWDLEKAVCIRELDHKRNSRAESYHVALFSPADDVLVTGGNYATCLVHELLPRDPVGTFGMPDDAKQALTVACASGAVVVMARGIRLAAVARDTGRPMWGTDFEEDIGVGNYLMALQPTGGQVAVCIPKLQVVSLRDLQTSSEIKRLPFEGGISGVNYSPDGSLLTIYGDRGVKVYEAATGKELHSFRYREGEDGNIHNCVVDPSGKFLVISGQRKCVVKHMQSGKVVHALEDSCITNGFCASTTQGSGWRIPPLSPTLYMKWSFATQPTAGVSCVASGCATGTGSTASSRRARASTCWRVPAGESQWVVNLPSWTRRREWSYPGVRASAR